MDKDKSKRTPDQPQRGPLPNPEKSAKVKCARKDCSVIVTIRGGRLAAYRSKGTVPYHSQDCRRLDAAAWVEGLCACGCGQTWRKYQSEVKRISTGRIFVDATHAIGQGTKPRRGTEGICEGCDKPMYLKPYEVGKKRTHNLECRRLAERKVAIKKTCPTCGKGFTVWPSKAETIYDTMHCRRIGMMTRAIPGSEHNGLPKRWDDKGYVLVYEPDHPASGKYGWVFEHRLVVERREGRYLTPREEVDHLDEVKDNNHPDNLEIKTKAVHAARTSGDIWRRRREADAELEQLREEKRLREAGYRPVGEVTDEALRILTELVAADALTDEQKARLAAHGA